MTYQSTQLTETAQDVLRALPNPEGAQLTLGENVAFIVTDKQIFEIYQTGEDVYVQVATRGTFEAVGDDTMWWATIPGETNPHFTAEALSTFTWAEDADEAEYQSSGVLANGTYTEKAWPTAEQFDKAAELGAEYAQGQIHEGMTTSVDSPLSGEWADGPTARSVAAQVGWDVEEMIMHTEGDAVDELADAWERGYNDVWSHA